MGFCHLPLVWKSMLDNQLADPDSPSSESKNARRIYTMPKCRRTIDVGLLKKRREKQTARICEESIVTDMFFSYSATKLVALRSSHGRTFELLLEGIASRDPELRDKSLMCLQFIIPNRKQR